MLTAQLNTIHAAADETVEQLRRQTISARIGWGSLAGAFLVATAAIFTPNSPVRLTLKAEKAPICTTTVLDNAVVAIADTGSIGTVYSEPKAFNPNEKHPLSEYTYDAVVSFSTIQKVVDGSNWTYGKHLVDVATEYPVAQLTGPALLVLTHGAASISQSPHISMAAGDVAIKLRQARVPHPLIDVALTDATLASIQMSYTPAACDFFHAMNAPQRTRLTTQVQGIYTFCLKR